MVACLILAFWALAPASGCPGDVFTGNNRFSDCAALVAQTACGSIQAPNGNNPINVSEACQATCGCCDQPPADVCGGQSVDPVDPVDPAPTTRLTSREYQDLHNAEIRALYETYGPVQDITKNTLYMFLILAVLHFGVIAKVAEEETHSKVGDSVKRAKLRALWMSTWFMLFAELCLILESYGENAFNGEGPIIYRFNLWYLQMGAKGLKYSAFTGWVCATLWYVGVASHSNYEIARTGHKIIVFVASPRGWHVLCALNMIATVVNIPLTFQCANGNKFMRQDYDTRVTESDTLYGAMMAQLWCNLALGVGLPFLFIIFFVVRIFRSVNAMGAQMAPTMTFRERPTLATAFQSINSSIQFNSVGSDAIGFSATTSKYHKQIYATKWLLVKMGMLAIVLTVCAVFFAVNEAVMADYFAYAVERDQPDMREENTNYEKMSANNTVVIFVILLLLDVYCILPRNSVSLLDAQEVVLAADAEEEGDEEPEQAEVPPEVGNSGGPEPAPVGAASGVTNPTASTDKDL